MIVILGAGGFALECAEILYQMGFNHSEISFFDNVSSEFNSYILANHQIIRTFKELEAFEDFSYVIGIGNPFYRKKFAENLKKIKNASPLKLISPYANIGSIENKISEEINIMTGSIVTSQCTIEKGVLINLNCTIGHNTFVGKYTEICPGVCISGSCHIEEGVFIGTGAILLPKIRIGKGAIIAAGAIVTSDVSSNTMVAGNPAKFKKETTVKW